MKIYIVTRKILVHGSYNQVITNRGVFSTKERAESFIQCDEEYIKKAIVHFDLLVISTTYEITPFEIDNPDVIFPPE